MELFFSNKIERLYDSLKERLFSASSPFAGRQLYVSSSMMKGWLTRRLADDLGICMGIEVHFHQQLMRDLVHLGQAALHFPSSVELSLAIETLLKQGLLEEDAILLSLIGSESKTKKSRRKLALLSHELATLFTQYGLYGSPILENPDQHWQGKLWQKLFERGDWTYPLKMVKEASKMVIETPVEIHLFGVSYLPPVYHRFLQRLAPQIPISYYLLSPTQSFWSDIVTDKQLGKMLKGMPQDDQEEMEELLRDRNIFLANMGKLGRQFLREVEKEDLPSSEDYVLCEQVMRRPSYEDLIAQDIHASSVTKGTLLDHLQGDLLLLRSPQEKIDLKKDLSITIHSAPSLRREVEVLYDNILRLMHEEHLQPEEILVMAPDVNDYHSALRAAFGAQESLIHYQMYNLSMLSENRLARGFILLLDLADSRWDSVSLMQLFEHPDFQKGQSLKPEDVTLMREWIVKTQISWGEDSSHRSEILTRYQIKKEGKTLSEVGTWHQGIDRLLDALALGGELLTVEFSQGSALGQWSDIFHHLRGDLDLLETPKTLNDWIVFLGALLEKYFSQRRLDQSSTEEYENLLQAIAQLYSKENEGSLYPWVSIRLSLEQLMNRQETSPHEGNLNAVRFCSLAPMRGMPAQALFLIGMEDGLFPRKKKSSPHEIFSACEIPPTSSDYDRYLFLEAIISVRSFLTISFAWGNDNHEKIPSSIVSELLDYLDVSYLLDGKKVSEMNFFHHPHTSYSTEYFEGNSELNSYSENNYHLALASLKKKHELSIPLFSVLPEKLVYEDREMEVSKLTSSLRNPIRAYLRGTHRIYLNNEESLLLVDEPFLLNALDLYQWKKEMFSKTTEEIVLQAYREGKFPSGLFGKYAAQIVDSHRKALKEALEAFNIDPSEIFSISFQDHSFDKTPQQQTLPPVEVFLECSIVRLTGKIEGITSQGCLIDDKMTTEALVKNGATIALFLNAISLLPFEVAPRILFLKDGKMLTLDKNNPLHHLEKMMKYVLSAEKHLFLYLPEWMEAWIDATSTEKLNSCIEKSLSDPHAFFYNIEAQWLWRGRSPPAISPQQHKEGAAFILEHLPFLGRRLEGSILEHQATSLL